MERIHDIADKQKNDFYLFIKDYHNNKFNSKQSKDLFNKIFIDNLDYMSELNKLLSVTKNYGDNELIIMIEDILTNHPETKQELISRPEKAEKFIIGTLMKLTKGQANPIQIKQILNKFK